MLQQGVQQVEEHFSVFFLGLGQHLQYISHSKGVIGLVSLGEEDKHLGGLSLESVES